MRGGIEPSSTAPQTAARRATGQGRAGGGGGRRGQGLAALIALVPLLASAQQSPEPTGFWLTEEETAVIEIRERAGTLRGRIHWIEPGGRRFDNENPDPDLHDRPLCGLEILSGFERNPDRSAEWRAGEIYAADEGKTYSARIRVRDPEELDLRGYVGISLFGRTQTWTRVRDDDYPRCEPPA